MNNLKKIENLVLEAIEDGAFPGANYAIIFKDKAYVNSLGNKALFPNIEKNDLTTIYDMASLTKVICTTTAILILMEEGKIRLANLVTKYLPDFPYGNITVFDLVTHTSGLYPDVFNVSKLKDEKQFYEQAYTMGVKAERGKQIIYSDIGFAILGKIVEVISGKKLNDFVKEYIFDPLGMKDSGYLPKDPMRCAPTEERNDEMYQGIVRGNVHDETAYALGGVAGHAGLFSTIEDVVKFVQMIMNNGKLNGVKILSKASIDALYRPLVEDKNGNMVEGERRTIGWINRTNNGPAGDLTSHNTILHTGFTGTNIWIDRDNEIAFAMLTNRVHPTRGNGKHIEVRARLANFIMAHLEELKEEI